MNSRAPDRSLHPLIWVELVVAFLPVSLVLVAGIFMTPLQLAFLVTMPEVRSAPGGVFEVVAPSILGVLGLIGLANLVSAIPAPANAWCGRRMTIAFGSAGMAALGYLAWVADGWAWKLMFVGPLLVAIHLIYLGRAFLLGKHRD